MKLTRSTDYSTIACVHVVVNMVLHTVTCYNPVIIQLQPSGSGLSKPVVELIKPFGYRELMRVYKMK